MTDLDEVDPGYLWNLYLGRIKPEIKTCARCGRPIIHSSDWWVDAKMYTPECTHKPGWFGHYPMSEGTT